MLSAMFVIHVHIELTFACFLTIHNRHVFILTNQRWIKRSEYEISATPLNPVFNENIHNIRFCNPTVRVISGHIVTAVGGAVSLRPCGQ